MSHSMPYQALSQAETRNDSENESDSHAGTLDELTSSSLDSLDLVLVEIGNKRKVRRKRRKKMGGIESFEGAESYEVRNVVKPVSLRCPVPRGFLCSLQHAKQVS